MKRNYKRKKLYKRVHDILFGLLFASLLFVSLHTLIHNNFDHAHNSSCSVYVLEELYFGADIVDISTLFVLFIPFAPLLYKPKILCVETLKQFTIRAPPLF